MEKSNKLKSLFLMLFMALSAQFVNAQNNLPILHEGLQLSVSSNKNNTKGLDIFVKDISYRDSSRSSCKADITLVFSSRNEKIHFGQYKDGLGNYHEEYRFNLFHISDVLPKNGVLEKKVSIWIKEKSQHNDSILRLGKNDLAYIPTYNRTEYVQKEKERNLAIQLAHKAKQDSIFRANNTTSNVNNSKDIEEVESRREKLLTPEYLSNWVGASFFTKENIEKDCNVSPVAYSSGKVFYDFPKCPVTMEFTDKSHVCISVSFRLFGEDGYNFKKELIDYGYKLTSKSSALIAENNFGDMGYGQTSIYKKRLKNGDFSVVSITEGQAFMFEFCRSKK